MTDNVMYETRLRRWCQSSSVPKQPRQPPNELLTCRPQVFFCATGERGAELYKLDQNPSDLCLCVTHAEQVQGHVRP